MESEINVIFDTEKILQRKRTTLKSWRMGEI